MRKIYKNQRNLKKELEDFQINSIKKGYNKFFMILGDKINVNNDIINFDENKYWSKNYYIKQKSPFNINDLIELNEKKFKIKNIEIKEFEKITNEEYIEMGFGLEMLNPFKTMNEIKEKTGVGILDNPTVFIYEIKE